MSYDAVASHYDQHFARRVDQLEDQRLAGLLRPLVDGRTVLDLGCGTGWLLDHTAPASYAGVDSSVVMLTEHAAKHSDVDTTLHKIEVGPPQWWLELYNKLPQSRTRRWEVIVATWAADYFPLTSYFLYELARLTTPGGILALHGATPRGHRRRHFIQPEMPWHRFTPANALAATQGTGMDAPAIHGIGASDLPGLWRASLAAPPAWHYSILAVWTTPRRKKHLA